MATLNNFPIGLQIRMARMLVDLIWIFEAYLKGLNLKYCMYGWLDKHAEVGQNYDNDEWPIMAFFSSIWLFVHVLCLI